MQAGAPVGMEQELALSRQQTEHTARLRSAEAQLEAALRRAEQAEFMLTTISRAVIAAPDCENTGNGRRVLTPVGM